MRPFTPDTSVKSTPNRRVSRGLAGLRKGLAAAEAGGVSTKLLPQSTNLWPVRVTPRPCGRPRRTTSPTALACESWRGRTVADRAISLIGDQIQRVAVDARIRTTPTSSES